MGLGDEIVQNPFAEEKSLAKALDLAQGSGENADFRLDVVSSAVKRLLASHKFDALLSSLDGAVSQGKLTQEERDAVMMTAIRERRVDADRQPSSQSVDWVNLYEEIYGNHPEILNVALKEYKEAIGQEAMYLRKRLAVLSEKNRGVNEALNKLKD